MMIKKKYRLLTILGAGLVEALYAALYAAVFILVANSSSSRFGPPPSFLAFLPWSIFAALACGIMSMLFWMAFVVMSNRITVRRGMLVGLASTIFAIPLMMILIEVYDFDITPMNHFLSFWWTLRDGLNLGIKVFYFVTVTTYGSVFLLGSLLGWHYAWFVRKFCSQETRPRESLYSSPSKRAENRQD